MSSGAGLSSGTAAGKATSATTSSTIADPADTSRSYKRIKTPWKISEFNGKNVSLYLRKYNMLAKDSNLEGKDKCERFTIYCAIDVMADVECLPGFSNGNWDTFEKSLKKLYFDLDSQQKEYQVPFRRSLAESQKQKGATGLKAYSTQFMRIVKVLLDEGKMTQYTACAEFYGGLPENMQDEVQRNLKIDWSDVRALNVEEVIQEVIDMEDRRLE